MRSDLGDFLEDFALVIGAKAPDLADEEAEIERLKAMDAAQWRTYLRENQANYSLAWYFTHYFAQDVADKSLPGLRALLGEDVAEVREPPACSQRKRDQIVADLETKFPRSGSALNDHQIEAVVNALTLPVSIVKGPPGTGKTEVILRMASLAAARGETVAIVSTNRAAVENVRDKVMRVRRDYLAKCGGKPSSLEEDTKKDYALRLAVRHIHMGNKAVRKEASASVELLKEQGLIAQAPSFSFTTSRDSLSGQSWVSSESFADVTAHFPVVTSTIHSLKKCFSDGARQKFDLVIVDEASQVGLVVGVVAASCGKRLVIVGDEEQLPPVVRDEVAEQLVRRHAAWAATLDPGMSLLELAYSRLLGSAERERIAVGGSNNGVKPGVDGRESLNTGAEQRHIATMLNVHYRCHRAISGFFASEVYQGKLELSERLVEARQQEFDVPLPIRIRWYEGDYRESTWMNVPESGWKSGKLRSSVVNRKQLEVLRREELPHIRDLIHAGKSICILSPFRGQIREIEDLLKRELYVTPKIEEDFSTADSVISLTIHKAQGQEFDAVYLLPVEDGDWEWPWSQGKRLINVACSRAKNELILLTSTKMMGADLQRRIAGRTIPVLRGANMEKPEADNELFLRRLVSYTYEICEAMNGGVRYRLRKILLGVLQLLGPAGVLAQLENTRTLTEEKPAVKVFTPEEIARQRAARQYGIIKSRVVSIFDDIPVRQTPGANWKKSSAPETVAEDSLRRMLTAYPELEVRAHVPLTELSVNGDPIGEEVFDDLGYIAPSEAHFDYVIARRKDHRVVAALEIDGGYHRFYRSPKKDVPDAIVEKSDARKDRLASQILGGVLVSLSERSVPVRQLTGDVGQWSTPCGTWPENPSFALIRIPANGTTSGEFAWLDPQSRETVDAVIDRQMVIMSHSCQVAITC